MDLFIGMNLEVLMFLCVFLAAYIIPVRSQTRIELTAPINPVDENGILSIHCHVFNLQKDHDVTMIRTLAGGSERLSMNEDVLTSVEDRVFVASRQLNDGSVVFFLSIIDTTKADTGLYECSVLSTSGRGDDLPSESVYVESTYFPSESDPVCSSSLADGNLEIQEGEELQLNCSSELASPQVFLSWERNGARTWQHPNEEIIDNRVFSFVTFKPTRKDNNAVFVCTVSSISFPERTQTCHIGPLTVLFNPNTNNNNLIPVDSVTSKVPSNTKGDDKVIQDQTFNSEIDIWSEIPQECQSACSATSTSVFYWILATIVAAVLAIVFFLVCLSVFLKYYSMKRADHGPYYLPGQLTAEEIYSEVEQKRDNRLYMALDKRECNPNLDCHNYIATNARRL